MRVRLALNVPALAAATEFYAGFFGAPPCAAGDGWVRFDLTAPPLSLTLFEGGSGLTLDHLGIEVDTSAQVAAANRRLVDLGFGPHAEQAVACCDGTRDRVRVRAPDGSWWEVSAAVPVAVPR